MANFNLGLGLGPKRVPIKFIKPDMGSLHDLLLFKCCILGCLNVVKYGTLGPLHTMHFLYEVFQVF